MKKKGNRKDVRENDRHVVNEGRSKKKRHYLVDLCWRDKTRALFFPDMLHRHRHFTRRKNSGFSQNYLREAGGNVMMLAGYKVVSVCWIDAVIKNVSQQMCIFQHFVLQYSTDWIHVSRLHGGKIWAAEAKQKCKNIGVQSLLMEPSAGARCQETHWIRWDAVTFPL